MRVLSSILAASLLTIACLLLPTSASAACSNCYAECGGSMQRIPNPTCVALCNQRCDREAREGEPPASSFGALVVSAQLDDGTPGDAMVQFAHGNDERNVLDYAFRGCRQKATHPETCRLIGSYKNSCAALVIGRRARVSAFASWSKKTREEAERSAIATCEKATGVRCSVYLSECSFDIP